jgi:hypothetical protein
MPFDKMVNALSVLFLQDAQMPNMELTISSLHAFAIMETSILQDPWD